MDIMKSNLVQTIQQNQDNMIYHAGNRKIETLKIGEEVFVHNFGIGSKWL